MVNINSWPKALVLVFFVYVLSHFLMLFLYGAWWDDWGLWNVPNKSLYSLLGPDNFNHPIMYWMIYQISKINDMELMTFVFRLIPFICWMISTISFFVIVKKITSNLSFTLYSSLLVASCGINKCIFLIICYHYTVSISLFMVGLVAFVYDYYNENRWLKLCTALLWLSSLIVWRSAVLVIPVFMLYVSILKQNVDLDDYRKVSTYKNIIEYVFLKYWVLLIALIIFVLLYKTLLAPKGSYVDYYSVSMINILLSPIAIITSSLSLILGYFSLIFEFFSNNGSKIIYFSPIFILCFFVVRKVKFETIKNRNYIIITGFLFLAFSLAPHVLRHLEYSYTLTGYSSRVVSLAIFPLSIIVTYFVFMMPCRFRHPLFVIILSSSIINCYKLYTDFNRGWARNEAITLIFEQNSFLEGKNIVVKNRALEFYSFFNEYDRFYEYEGCARMAYGMDTKTQCVDYYVAPIDSKVDYYMIIDKNNSVDFDNLTYSMKLFTYRILKKSKYKKMLLEMLHYRIVSSFDYNTLSE